MVEKVSEKIAGKTMVPYFNDYTTSHYKLNFFKTCTGLYFLLLTSVSQYTFTRVLKYIYSNIYIELVCKNPLAKPNERILSPKFSTTLKQYLEKLEKGKTPLGVALLPPFDYLAIFGHFFLQKKLEICLEFFTNFCEECSRRSKPEPEGVVRRLY